MLLLSCGRMFFKTIRQYSAVHFLAFICELHFIEIHTFVISVSILKDAHSITQVELIIGYVTNEIK